MDTIRGHKKNNRLFPGFKGRRPDNAKHRREEAIERQAAYDLLTLEQKLAQLPPEPFAKKQRAKLLAIQEKAK